MKRVLIVGATSAIAEATSRLYAAEGARLFLVARNRAKLEAVAADLRVRGAAAIDTFVMDANAFDDHRAVVDHARETLGGIDLALVAQGTLPDQKACEQSFERIRGELETNCLSVISLLTHLANLMEGERGGTLAAITSVAGDRGRQSNYVYGAAKGAVSLFLQGLRNRLSRSGVCVLTIKPGVVKTPMTAECSQGALWSEPDRIARGIKGAVEKRRNVVYLPGFWRPIMFVIRAIPEEIFKRLSL